MNVKFLLFPLLGFLLGMCLTKSSSTPDEALIQECKSRMEKVMKDANHKLLEAQSYLDTNNVVYRCSSDSSKCRP